jgi:CheY-like chemotaxis protein/Tfp pilus assembly protein PilZ
MPRRVLVADSDYGFAQRLRVELEARGHIVEIVSDGLSAINMLKTRPFDGVVVDTDLITVGGLQVLQTMMEMDRALPVVVTSARDRQGLERQLKQAGTQVYVSKPCSPGEVVDALLQATRVGVGRSPGRRPSVTLASPEPGQVLLIECPGAQVQGRLSSKLLAKHPASLAVAAPRRDREPVSLPFGARVMVGFPMPDGWYQFETSVLGATSYGGQPAVLLAQPKLVSHVQRRRYARSRGAFSAELEGEQAMAPGIGQDAGEGGIGVLTESALRVGARVLCRIEAAPSGQRLTLSGTVVWIQELRDNGHRYRTGVEFRALSPAERKRLRAWMEHLGQPGQDTAGSHPSFSSGLPALV